MRMCANTWTRANNGDIATITSIDEDVRIEGHEDRLNCTYKDMS